LDPGPDLLPYILRLLGEDEPQKPAAADEPASHPQRSPLGRVMRLAEPARQLIQGEYLIYAFHNIAHRFALEGCATAVDLSGYAPAPVPEFLEHYNEVNRALRQALGLDRLLTEPAHQEKRAAARPHRRGLLGRVATRQPARPQHRPEMLRRDR